MFAFSWLHSVLFQSCLALSSRRLGVYMCRYHRLKHYAVGLQRCLVENISFSSTPWPHGMLGWFAVIHIGIVPFFFSFWSHEVAKLMYVLLFTLRKGTSAWTGFSKVVLMFNFSWKFAHIAESITITTFILFVQNFESFVPDRNYVLEKSPNYNLEKPV